MTIIITDEDVKRLLPMRDCIEATRVAFGVVARQSADQTVLVAYCTPAAQPESFDADMAIDAEFTQCRPSAG
jgi:hypothetical protein